MIEQRDGAPDLCELVGRSVGASVLTMDPRRDETHLVRVAAMGGAARQISQATDVSEPWIPTDRDVIESRLAPLLWRLKFGGDATRETALEAVRLFARWLAGTLSWRNHPVPGDQAQRFAARLICEWLADKCPACGGTGVQELLRGGMPRRPRRFGGQAVREAAYGGGRGTRSAQTPPMARARALEVSLAEYRAVWAGRMDRARQQLVMISRRLTRPLHSQLERGKNRA